MEIFQKHVFLWFQQDERVKISSQTGLHRIFERLCRDHHKIFVK